MQTLDDTSRNGENKVLHFCLQVTIIKHLVNIRFPLAVILDFSTSWNSEILFLCLNLAVLLCYTIKDFDLFCKKIQYMDTHHFEKNILGPTCWIVTISQHNRFPVAAILNFAYAIGVPGWTFWKRFLHFST